MSNIGNSRLGYLHLSAASLTRFIINYVLGILPHSAESNKYIGYIVASIYTV